MKKNLKRKIKSPKDNQEVYKYIQKNLIGKLKAPKGETALTLLGRE